MCEGRRFQADGAATEKELLESWRLNREYNKVTTRCGAESSVRARLTEFGQICRCRSVDNSVH